MPHTDVKVKLIGEDGNAFVILGKVDKALVLAGYHNLARLYRDEVMLGDYDNLLRVTMKYVEVE